MNTGKIFLRKTVAEKLIRIADRVGKGQCLLPRSTAPIYIRETIYAA